MSTNRIRAANNARQYGAPQEAYYVPHGNNSPSHQHSKQKKEEESGCCQDKTDELDYSTKDTTCSSCLLTVFRILVFAALCVRFYLNVKDTYTSLFYIFEFLTHFGFSITIIFYALCIWDLLLNCCGSNKTVPKYLQKNTACQGQPQYSFKQLYQLKQWSLPFIGSQSMRRVLIQQVKNSSFSFIMG